MTLLLFGFKKQINFALKYEISTPHTESVALCVYTVYSQWLTHKILVHICKHNQPIPTQVFIGTTYL